MGLDTSHDCWHGPYTAFHRWRCWIAREAGLPPLELMDGFSHEGKPGIRWDRLKPDPLLGLLNHSDCDGEIRWEDCELIADALDVVLDNSNGRSPEDRDMIDATKRFIAGLRAAAAARENVEFH